MMARQTEGSVCVLVVAFTLLWGQSQALLTNSTECPEDCQCAPDSDVTGGVDVTCIGVNAVPAFWPEGTTSVNLELVGFPGIPSASFLDMNNLCTIDIGGEVGFIANGAFENLVGDGCDHTELPQSRNRLIFLGADITTIQSVAFNNIRGFQYIQFMRTNDVGDIGVIEQFAFTNVQMIQSFSFEYMQVGFLDDEAFRTFRNVDVFEFDAATIRSINTANVGPFSDFVNVTTLKFEQLRSDTEWEHGFTSNFFTGIGDGVSSIVFQNFEVSYIDADAFQGVKGLDKIEFTDVKIDNITTNAFNGLENVEEIHFKGHDRNSMSRIVFQERPFAGMRNVRKILFEFMDIDLARYNFADAAMLKTVHFLESAIAEGDVTAFAGLDADSLIMDCIILPSETQSHWAFATVSRLGHLSYKYDPACQIKGEAWFGFSTIGNTGVINKITFENVTIKNLNHLAIYRVENVEEMSFTDCIMERTEPNAFSDLKNFSSLVFRRVKWEYFLPQTFSDFQDFDLIEFDDVDLGLNGILPTDAFLDIDNVKLMRFNNLDIEMMSTRSFGWDGSSSGIDRFEITNSQINSLQSFAFHGLSNVNTFSMDSTDVRCMETGAFMNMKAVKNHVFTNNELPCDPILDVPWHMDWTDRRHCVTDGNPNCLVVTDPPTTVPPTDPQTDGSTGPPTEPPTDPPTAAPTDPPTTPISGAGSITSALLVLGFGSLLAHTQCWGVAA